MTSFKFQTALGGFVLLTLMLAGAAVGRVMGIGFGDALYLTASIMVALGWTLHQVMQRGTRPSRDNNGEE